MRSAGTFGAQHERRATETAAASEKSVRKSRTVRVSCGMIAWRTGEVGESSGCSVASATTAAECDAALAATTPLCVCDVHCSGVCLQDRLNARSAMFSVEVGRDETPCPSRTFVSFSLLRQGWRLHPDPRHPTSLTFLLPVESLPCVSRRREHELRLISVSPLL